VAEGTDVLIVGAGPAGIATAIAARLKGLSVTVVDARRPPLEKACGEGLLPEGVCALAQLGIHLNSEVAYPIAGIRFCDEDSSASGRITGGVSYGLRRTALHRLLVERANEVGVTFRWGTRVSELNSNAAQLDGEPFSFRWLVGADGQKSGVGKWAGLKTRRAISSRFGFSRHFAIAPWTDFVEVHWGQRCQIYVTPTGPGEMCVTVLTSDPQMRVAQALELFPAVRDRLLGAPPLTAELGCATVLERSRPIVRGRVALVGDASFTVDGIAGQGLSLAFQQAIQLGEALASGDLAGYQAAHRKIIQTPARVARLLLLLDRNAWLRRKTLRILAADPSLFSQLASWSTRDPLAASMDARKIFGLSWQVLRA
jgi:flavin-dependent dehydrogenase